MMLKIYQQKRNFKKTPEPKGRPTKSKKNNNLFIIQKHAASHLHYDFRLELNGVLLSWAVPKGPSLDPSVKRLAMHVEDHPVEYGSFEGIIPQGQYGGGTVMLWDKGEWIPEDSNPTEAYQKGNMTFRLKAEKLNGKWKLIRINKNDKTWLLIKLKDEFAQPQKKYDITVEEPNSVKTSQSIEEIAENYKNIWGKKGLEKKKKISKKKVNKKLKLAKLDLPKQNFPNIIYPQLATLVDKPPIGHNWAYEIKFDGYRLIAFKQDKNVKLFTRHHNDWTNKFKTIARAISQLPVKNLIIDGEIVVLDENHRSNFQLLQNSIKEQEAEFIFYAFDLIYFNQYNLTHLPLLERKNILKKIVSQGDANIIRYSDHVIGNGNEIFKKTCELGLEGIIAKDIYSSYTQTRDKNWLKIKCIKRQEFVIGGFLKSERRQGFRSLMLGTFDKNNQLIYCGNVGTGFTQSSLKTIHSLLSKHLSPTMPFLKTPPQSKSATWVKPVVVAEIEFTEWTNDGTLRHPSFKGIRKDKSAIEVRKEIETPVEKVMQIKKEGKKRDKISKEILIKPYKLTHPEKILFPESKITKQNIAEYYETVQDWILPYVTNRPLSLVRCPDNYQECFFQKHINKKPAGIYGVNIKEKKGVEKEYIFIRDYEGLLAFSQMGVLEIHPWECQIKNIEHPDTIIFDLDPAPKLPWKQVVSAAFEIKKLLDSLKLKSFVKTTGGKGLHVVIPIKPHYGWDEIKKFSHALVSYMVKTNPDKYIGKMTKISRQNKIFIDYLRNQRGATAIAPYSTRARKHAPVATPLDWDELTNNYKDTFYTIKTLPKRLNNLKKDPWADFFKIKQSLDFTKLK